VLSFVITVLCRKLCKSHMRTLRLMMMVILKVARLFHFVKAMSILLASLLMLQPDSICSPLMRNMKYVTLLGKSHGKKPLGTNRR
jgi:hypothetical protein